MLETFSLDFLTFYSINLPELIPIGSVMIPK